ncbi:MAG: transcription termination factor Rho [Pseudomonadota bacterium]
MEIDLDDLRSRSTAELVSLGLQSGIEKATSLGRQDLVFEILCQRTAKGAQVPGSGVLEILPDGFGFLRTARVSYLPGADDIYVSPSQIRRFHLRTGDLVVGRVRTPKENERYIALIKVEQVNGYDPEAQDRPTIFDNLTPAFPNEPLRLEHDPADTTSRLLDLVVPMGLGQRVLVHAPPGSEGLLLYEHVLRALRVHHPATDRILLLLQARPEQAAEAAALPAEVIATTFDEPASRHIQAAEIVSERARRLAEAGRDVILFVHTVTNLCRAFEEQAGGQARLGQAGLDGAVLARSRRILADAHRLVEGGSLTVFATLRAGPQPRLDQAIAESFLGTATARITLDTSLAVPGLRPGLDPLRSACRTDHRLLAPEAVAARARLRASLPADPAQALDRLLAAIAATSSNAALLAAPLDRAAQTGE